MFCDFRKNLGARKPFPCAKPYVDNADLGAMHASFGLNFSLSAWHALKHFFGMSTWCLTPSSEIEKPLNKAD